MAPEALEKSMHRIFNETPDPRTSMETPVITAESKNLILKTPADNDSHTNIILVVA